MNYSTLEGTTDALHDLVDGIDAVKTECTNAVLAQTSDQWPKVQDYLQEAINNINTAITTYPSSYGSPMEAIASKYGG